ncbi:hypothetical protein ABB37_02945 [Leptomonas pyrrhocoris]|uniref:DUF155 domain-containing protein n=1 Tax=Leptomonas pyrrhocoris TaxID=157538 RepID=A0A0N0DXS1_LEPPY|nr:hypothetical protein ABB37_02945 [Leptomonas pyrrhocoris]XP_015661711.1 hypothetical protein ABB37_02945 [Leptomonas pyrrhocoris]KPA83271.1 hypothetical protein ABB37_02945 [Leptomonas pyrrhocoris]KPA83272.1 hypothetical protein ABB37_02945 [Leptomonas pyrrhocoris]|eukprot:XP_015661710.1 hypothetical protein ABB37_02945 [Leptomonas pyrrhocoris]
MERLYEQENSYDAREQPTDPASSSSSLSSAERGGQGRRRQQRHPEQQHRHRSQRYATQMERQDSHPHYSRHHETVVAVLQPHHRRRSSSSSLPSVNAHLQRTRPRDEDDDTFHSLASGVPSLEVAELMHVNNPSDVGLMDVAPSVAEDFPMPTWAQEGRLMERRIQQAVDHDPVELKEPDGLPAEGGGAYGAATRASLGSAAAGKTVDASMMCGGTGARRRPSSRPSLLPESTLPLFPQDNSATAAPSSASLTTPLSAPPGPRMKEAELLADPRNRLLSLVLSNTAAGVTLSEIEQAMRWSALYEPMYGPLLEYLQSYQSIFVVSPVDDRVRLRRHFSIRTSLLQQPPPQHQLQRTSRTRLSRRGGRDAAAQRSSSAVDRRPGKSFLPSAEVLAAHIGSISYSCVAERLDLDTLETVYRRRGYDTAMMHTVLHVTSEKVFHLFLFSSGAVVWWGMDRKEHWMVEEDFLSETLHIAEGVDHRYGQAEIDALFPIWCSYEVDEECNCMQVASPLGIQPSAVKPALERLSKLLCFDHYLVPANEPARSLVMLTFSHSLGSSARVDYFEYVTKWSHRHILSIPPEFPGLLDYFSTKRRVRKLEGEIAVAQLAVQSIHDTPEVLWEVPWLQAYYDMSEQQNTVESRLSWFASRSDTLLEQLSHIKARRHRLFMLGSDVFLIVLLILDVMFMTSRLVAKMYFKVEEDD